MFGKPIVLLILLITLGIGSAGLVHAGQVVIRPDKDEYTLGLQTEILEDPSGRLDLEAVRNGRFQPSESEVINLGFSRSVYWLRISVNNHSRHPASDWVIDLAYPVLSEITLYAPDAVFRTGGELPFESRPINHRDFAFPLKLTLGKTDTFYFQIRSNAPHIYPMTLETRDRWRENNSVEDTLAALFFGALLIMIVYNLLLYFSVRDPDYVPYILYVVFFGLFFFGLRGYSKQYLTPESLYLNLLTINGAIGLGGWAIIRFSRQFLNMKYYVPVWDKAFRVFEFVWLGFALAAVLNVESWFPQSTFVLSLILNLISGIQPIAALTVGMIVRKKGFLPANFYILAFGSLLVGILVQVLKNLGIFRHDNFTEYSFQYGILIEQALLSIALADKINVANAEKERAQANSIATLRENERIISEQNRFLEEKVEERTRELNNSNLQLTEVNGELVQLNEEIRQTLDYVTHQSDQIEAKNKDITESIEYARRIQTAILPDTDYIQLYFPRSFIYYQAKDIVSGDFYWFAHREKVGLSFFAAVDCTGHGVPGAFMSVIGYNMLNKVVLEQRLTDPAEILDSLDAGLRQILKQDQTRSDYDTMHDGMDIALCVVDRRLAKFWFAGATGKMYLVRGGELIVFAGDKFPVGGSQTAEKKFTARTGDLMPGDRFYFYSDGITDQFGGPDKRKFTPKRLQQFLLEHKYLSMPEQQKAFDRMMKEWMGYSEQIDDMMLIGFEPF